MKMKAIIGAALAAISVGLFNAAAHAAWPGDPPPCHADAVKAGSVCMDKYEASVWDIPATNLSGNSNAGLIRHLRRGTATLASLTAGNATQISPSSSCTPAFPVTFPANGQWTAPLYAVSIAGVHPTACVTWFQAQQACANSRKRLPSNAEWQMAVAGTLDPGPGPIPPTDNGTTDCNTLSVFDAVNTGSRSGCVSNWGAFDMVGNVDEWVADWVPLSTFTCPGWGFFSNDFMCLSGAQDVAGGPGALVRGGDFDSPGGEAGPWSVAAIDELYTLRVIFGFRCAR